MDEKCKQTKIKPFLLLFESTYKMSDLEIQRGKHLQSCFTAGNATVSNTMILLHKCEKNSDILLCVSHKTSKV